MMGKRTQLLVLLSCAVGIACLLASVGADSDNSAEFCCAEFITNVPGQGPVGTGCVAALSWYAGDGRNNKLSQCERLYRPGTGTGTGGAVLKATCESDGTCKPTCPSGACGDPHIVGLDGTHYLLWGKPNATYNLLSERHHHINVRLFHPPGHPDTQALYMDAVGLLIHSARITVTLARPTPPATAAALVLTIGSEAGPGAAAPVTYPGRPVERAVDALTSYAFRSPQKVTISSRDLVLSVVVAEGFYLDVMVDEVAAHWGDVHGVLGQTHARAFKLRYNYARGTAVGELPQDVIAQQRSRPYKIQGTEDDYIVSGLLRADDKFSRYVADEPVPVSRKLASNRAVGRAEWAQAERVRTVGAALSA